MRTGWLFAVLVAAAACGGSTGSSHTPAPDGTRPILNRVALSEEGPAAAGPWIAWMQSRGVNAVPPRSRTDVFVRRRGATVRVNPQGTTAQTGGIDGGWLVLQIARRGRSRLARYDLTTRRLSYLSAFVNDGAWLWRPDVDHQRILYGAIVPGRSSTLRYEIRLADLRRRSVRVLLSLDGHADYAAPGQLRGDWATWVSCPDNVCNVWRENLATGRADSAPDPDQLAHDQFGPAVDARGNVYFVRIKKGCANAELRSWNGRRDERVLRFAANTAFQYAYLAKGTNTLYFDLVGCARSARSDIYALTVPQPR